MRPFDQIPALERVNALDVPAGVLCPTSSRARSHCAGCSPGSRSGTPRTRCSSRSRIRAWVSAGWLDCLPRTERSATVLTGVGIAAALPAIAAGLVDYGTLGRRATRIAVVHATANAISLLCQVVSLRDRMTGRLRRGQWIGFAGTITLSIGGVLGGHLAHKLPDRTAAAGSTTSH